MIRIDYHSFDESLLSPGDWVIDVGCRGFGFSNTLANKGYNVIAIDPDPSIVPPANPKIHFEQKALVHGDNTELFYATWSTGEGNFVCGSAASVPSYATSMKVQCINLNNLMSKYAITQVGLLKLDCEGSEYDILMGLQSPIAKQISVEFHDFLGRNPLSPPENFYTKLFAHLGKWYKVVQHEKGPIKDDTGKVLCPVNNYWDTLLALKD